MSDFLNIGSSPSEEDCFGVGNPLAHQECDIYREQLEREFPAGDFRVKGFPHDFGRYYEVVAVFGIGEDEQTQAAWEAEGGASPVWDELAAGKIAALRAKAG
jgi:hypothetical protein